MPCYFREKTSAFRPPRSLGRDAKMGPNKSFDWWFSNILVVKTTTFDSREIWREHFWKCGLSEFILEDEKTIAIEFNPGKFASFISHKSTQKSRHKEQMKTFLLRQFFWCWTRKHTKKTCQFCFFISSLVADFFIVATYHVCLQGYPPWVCQFLAMNQFLGRHPAELKALLQCQATLCFLPSFGPQFPSLAVKNCTKRNKLIWVPKKKNPPESVWQNLGNPCNKALGKTALVSYIWTKNPTRLEGAKLGEKRDDAKDLPRKGCFIGWILRHPQTSKKNVQPSKSAQIQVRKRCISIRSRSWWWSLNKCVPSTYQGKFWVNKQDDIIP